jgi:hypothetical protein
MRFIVPESPASDFRSASVVYSVLDDAGEGYFHTELAVAAALFLWAHASQPHYPSTGLTLSDTKKTEDGYPERRKVLTASLRELALKTGKDGRELSPGVSRRVSSALCAKSFPDLVSRLRPLCAHAEGEGISIDYGQLSVDLYATLRGGVDTLDLSVLTNWNKLFWLRSSAERAEEADDTGETDQ